MGRRGPLSNATYGLRYFSPLRRSGQGFAQCPLCEAGVDMPCYTLGGKPRRPHYVRPYIGKQPGARHG